VLAYLHWEKKKKEQKGEKKHYKSQLVASGYLFLLA